jgi:hypothetical protein
MFAPLIFVVAASTPAPSTHGTCTLADFNGDGVYDTVDGVETRYRFDGRRYRQIAHHTYRAH